MSTSMTALAWAENTSWPFYTQENFATSFGQVYLQNTQASFLSWSPIIEGEFERVTWGPYSVRNAQDWLPGNLNTQVPPLIWTDPNVETGEFIETGAGPFTPVWEMAVPLEDQSSRIDPTVINYNALSNSAFRGTFALMAETLAAQLSPISNVSDIYGETSDTTEPTSLLMAPLFDTLDETQSLVGVVVAAIPWTVFYTDVLHPSQPPVYVVVEQHEGCGGNELLFTLEVEGEVATYLGPGRLIEEEYEHYGTSLSVGAQGTDEGSCYFTITVYPTAEVIDYYTERDNTAAIWTTIVVVVILLAGFVFFVYDYAVQRRQMKTMNSAAKTNAVLASLFPTEVRDRLLGKHKEQPEGAGAVGKDGLPSTVPMLPESTAYQLKNFMAEEDGASPMDDEKVKEAMAGIDMHETKPIAELFPNTTVLFADIAGFTAWSSVREPSQVFMLLETVYRAFDNIAKRRKVFKVETVGDCYVAVTGLPEPRKDHALVMAKFAKDCLETFNDLSKKLEIALGPDTGDLAMRAGLHSGPVTAGVLRGDRSRFQLFGDTVNTAARVEATGMRNRVQLSTDTASLLIAAGKQHWVKKRADIVTGKGKGELSTYWLVTRGSDDKSGETNNPQFAHRVGLNLDELEASLPPKIQRLVGWNVEILKKLLQQVIAHRNAVANKQNFDAQLARMETDMNKRKMLIGEVAEVIELPTFDAKAFKNQTHPSKVQIPDEVLKELKLYVCSIAAMHRDNYFHNFEHASHVTMSVSKLLSRIIAPTEIMDQGDGSGNLASALHDHTFGITSDPLTQFSVVLSALIHDTDHLGVSNAQLIKEHSPLAAKHKNKSVAEQNSIVLAWEKLMDPSFVALRRTIYGTPDELERFRAIVVNNVLATDIFDKQLQTVRKNRWEKAFAEGASANNNQEAINRKATIVLEHLIQSSDVSHTMQHWHIYRKWNERLFAEMTNAHKQGRLAFDPKAGWYQGELGFFDNYIIPLAKKLKECGVFGVSCDEYLNYALENRREWAVKGEEVVDTYIKKYCTESNKEDEKPSSEK
ncbi:MAG: hypothetical protein SGILL_006500 [Bacillariaceae sp.]